MTIPLSACSVVGEVRWGGRLAWPKEYVHKPVAVGG